MSALVTYTFAVYPPARELVNALRVLERANLTPDVRAGYLAVVARHGPGLRAALADAPPALSCVFESDGVWHPPDVLGYLGPYFPPLDPRELEMYSRRFGPMEAAPVASAPSPAPKKQRGPRKDITGQMMTLLWKDKTLLGWSAEAWARRLGCVSSSVKEAKAWKTIKRMRASEREESTLKKRARERQGGPG